MNVSRPCEKGVCLGDYIIIKEIEKNYRRSYQNFARKGKIMKTQSYYYGDTICNAIKEKYIHNLNFQSASDDEMNNIIVYFSPRNASVDDSYLKSDIAIEDGLMSAIILDNVICLKHERLDEYIYSKMNLVKIDRSIVQDYNLISQTDTAAGTLLKATLYRPSDELWYQELKVPADARLYFYLCQEINAPYGTFHIIEEAEDYYLVSIHTKCIVAFEL